MKTTIPWWIYASASALLYPSFTYIIPDLLPASGSWENIAGLLQQVAPIFTILLLLVAGNKLYSGDTNSDNSSSDEECEKK